MGLVTFKRCCLLCAGFQLQCPRHWQHGSAGEIWEWRAKGI